MVDLTNFKARDDDVIPGFFVLSVSVLKYELCTFSEPYEEIESWLSMLNEQTSRYVQVVVPHKVAGAHRVELFQKRGISIAVRIVPKEERAHVILPGEK